jgi:hypothetical protein
MTGIVTTVRDPPADRYTFGHARNTYIRQTRVCPNDGTGADE